MQEHKASACLLLIGTVHMKMQRKKAKLNNKGMSLVELIVAVAIISMISSIFYNCFVASARTNAKARIQHKATSLAQNIVEALKAEDINTILHQCCYPLYVDGAGVTQRNFQLLPENLVGTDSELLVNVRNRGAFAGNPDDRYVRTRDGGATVEYNQDYDRYEILLRNLEMEETKFDAYVVIDGSAYSETVVGAGSSSGQTFNDAEVVQIPTMDVNYDGVISNGTVYDELAIAHFRTKLLTDSQILAGINRRITVNIKDQLRIDGTYQQRIEVEYFYTCEGEEWRQMDSVFDNSDNTDYQLRNIFLFFPPHFEWTNYYAEQIIINNENNRELQLYLIKQQTTLDDMILMAEATNTAYHTIVNINETSSESTPAVEIRTNLGYTIKDGSAIPGNRQGEYHYTNAALSANFQYATGMGNVGGESKSVEEFFDFDKLTNKKVTDKLFDIRVEVFAYSGDEEINSESDWISYVDGLQEYKKATMTGTIRN